MSLEVVRQEASGRFQEAQAFLSSLKANEAQPGQQLEWVNVQKGLFLVLLYGAFEYSLIRTLIEATALINAHSLQYCHMSDQMYAFALDPQLRSVEESSRNTKWRRRSEIFRVQTCSNPVKLLESAFLTEVQNIWAETIQRSFDIFGITVPSLYDPRVKQYINEVVEKRNAVSHGRESAATIGKAYTLTSLQRLIDELNRQTQYIFSVFEEHLLTKGFVKTAHKSLY